MEDAGGQVPVSTWVPEPGRLVDAQKWPLGPADRIIKVCIIVSLKFTGWLVIALTTAGICD